MARGGEAFGGLDAVPCTLSTSCRDASAALNCHVCALRPNQYPTQLARSIMMNTLRV